MSLLDDLINDSWRNEGELCKAAVILSELDGLDVDGENAGAVLRDALGNPRVSSAAVSRLVAGLGYPIAASTLNQHRRDRCKCNG